MTIEGSLESGGGFDIEQLARDGKYIPSSFKLEYDISYPNLVFK